MNKWTEAATKRMAEIKQQEAEKDNRLAELQEKLTVAQSRIDSIVAKVTDVKNNLAYRLLPSWIKTKIENLIDWTDGE